jgi:hypothetical protein
MRNYRIGLEESIFTPSRRTRTGIERENNLGEFLVVMRFAMSACLLALAFTTATRAGEAQPVGPLLPPKLQDLLRQEMQAVLYATHEILDASIEGDYAKLADRARQIHDSFIMAQAMTEEDSRTLLATLPPDFIALDESFHVLSGNLAEAARVGDQELVGRYLGDMVAACGSCHARYARNRFPAFSAPR